MAISCIVMRRPAVAALAVEGGIVDLAVPHLRACGSPADLMVRRMVSGAEPYCTLAALTRFVSRMQSVSCASAEGSSRWWLIVTCLQLIKQGHGLAAFVVCGLFDELISAIKAYAAQQRKDLAFADTNIQFLYMALQLINYGRGQPGCETKIRGATKALSFCLDNSFDVCAEMGRTTGGAATTICAHFFTDFLCPHQQS